MNLIQIVNSTLTECKKGLIRLKNHPRVFIFGGMAVSTVGTVAACAATYKHIDRIMDTTKEKLENAQNGKEKAAAVGYCAAEMGKAFAGPAALVIAGNAAIAYGNHLHEEKEGILSEALTTVGAAYTALKERMEEKLGAEEAENVRLDAKDVEEVSEDGKKKKTEVVKEIDQLTGLEASPYAKFFDQSSRCYEDDPEYNMTFLKQMEWECNQQLMREGYLLLSDVYKKLDIPITKASLVAGWLYNHNNFTDEYVDFGLYDKSKWATRRFVNGYESVVLLDFNCAANIADYI